MAFECVQLGGKSIQLDILRAYRLRHLIRQHDLELAKCLSQLLAALPSRLTDLLPHPALKGVELRGGYAFLPAQQQHQQQDATHRDHGYQQH